MRISKILINLLFLMALTPAYASVDSSQRQTLVVHSTAYVTEDYDDEDESLGAWGDHLRPGMKVIAVSRDLLTMGLTYGVKVRIEGLKGHYIVMDKMNQRWEKRIDIYMGADEEAAWEWGLRKVKIHWPVDGNLPDFRQ